MSLMMFANLESN